MQYDELARQLAKKNASYIMALSKSVFWNVFSSCVTVTFQTHVKSECFIHLLTKPTLARHFLYDF